MRGLSVSLLALVLTMAAMASPSFAADDLVVKDKATMTRENEISRILNENRAGLMQAEALTTGDRKREAIPLLQTAVNNYKALNDKYPNEPQVLAELASAQKALATANNSQSTAKAADATATAAEDAATQNIKAHPNSADAYGARGTVRQKLGNAKGAAEDYRQAATLDPENAEWTRRADMLDRPTTDTTTEGYKPGTPGIDVPPPEDKRDGRPRWKLPNQK